ncbi:hypothetical protein H0Z60_04620 [Ectothiorhodospiraceae bacterium WFHF3C12]|nr:hypothetical protein [Ectothiorhodospiraceae bacterium WFHF3C12]
MLGGMEAIFDERFDDPDSAVAALAAAAQVPRRVLIAGPMGAGKSTLAGTAADVLVERGHGVCCLGADPGTPAFGPPGAVSLAARTTGGWSVEASRPLCTLDAARFRLPLMDAVRALAAGVDTACLLVDAPGVVRGVAGAELLVSLAGVLRPDLLVWLAPRPLDLGGLREEIAALQTRRWAVTASAAAARPARSERDRSRTARWNGYVDELPRRRMDLDGVAVLGTPPPRDAPDVWRGRMMACRDDTGRDWLGEVTDADAGAIEVALPGEAGEPLAVTIRDAGRDGDGLLVSRAPVREASMTGTVESAPQGPGAEVGQASVSLVNGIFGDPLMHLRLRHRRRSLLFDLGECNCLPTRVLHQVSDVFISHAHADHIGGFIAFLRARIGFGGPCRIYGPPGMAWNIEGLVRGIHWDRIGEAAPEFPVTEVYASHLKRFRVRAGRPGPEPLDTMPAGDGTVLGEDDFRVRAVTLDHGTPVLAFAFEPRGQANVRKECLAAMALRPGPWLTQLKRAWMAGRHDESITLPDGEVRTVRALAAELLVASPGRPVVYATDFADTPANRDALTALARGAHTLVCESPFLARDGEQARYTGHLTARACGEIAAAAGVKQLLPFHFSPRYEADPDAVYAEVARACPGSITVRR